MGVRVQVCGVPPWVPHGRLLGAGDWTWDAPCWTADLDRAIAADLSARLRGIGLGLGKIEVTVRPSLKRNLVRAARSEDAKRRRNTTPGFSKKGCKLDEEGRFSLTSDVLALKMAQTAQGLRVIDAGCGVGGNAIGFARAGCQVTAIERSPVRLKMAQHNAKIYGVSRQIRFLQGDAHTHLPSLEADLLFVDPPWGVDYDRAHCDLSTVPLLAQILDRYRERFPKIWAKLPPSFAPTDLPEATVEAWFGEAAGDHRRVKFSLLKTGA